MSSTTAGDIELQRTERGFIVQIEPFYLVVEFAGGIQANLLRSQWPEGAREPAIGLTIQCRYFPARHEVIEVVHIGLRSLRLSGTHPQPRSNHPTEAPQSNEDRTEAGGKTSAREPFDPEFFARQHYAGHNYEMMMFLRDRAAGGYIEWYTEREVKEARYSDPATPLSPPITRAIRGLAESLSDFRLYLHQARALEALRAGHDLLLVTQTASGKTLCYNPAIFETFHQRDPSARALYIFPLNALLIDQLEQINRLRESLKYDRVTINADLWIGGLSSHQRDRIAARNPHILGTNPEMLGLLLSRGTYEWRSFFERLRFIVIDEVHFYRGLLGVHMAGLLRRLALLTARLGVKPQLILSSTTVSDPLDLAARLTARPATGFSLIDEQSDGSQQAIKHWSVLSPIAASHMAARPYVSAAALAMVDLLCATDEYDTPRPINTVLFARSMKDVHVAYEIVRRNLEHRRPDLLPKVRKFIGAELKPDDKRQIYEGLKHGTYVGVISTHALEAGVDIGELRACIIAGFPYTVMRMRQMAGRVGRKSEGLVIYVPDPAGETDAFYRENPERLLTQPPEVFVVDADNPSIARRHLNAAAMELGSLSLQEAMIFGSRVDEIIAHGVRDQALIERRGRIFGTQRDDKNPHDLYAIQNIRANVQRPYAVCTDDGNRCPESTQCHSQTARSQESCKRQLTVIDRRYVYRDCHPEAIYEGPDGNVYKVTAFDDIARSVRVTRLPDDTLERTSVDEYTAIEIIGRPQGERQLANGAAIAWGRVRVTRHFEGYKRYDLIPIRRCRRCKMTYDEDVTACKKCKHPTEMAYRQSKAELCEFPEPFTAQGFRIELDTLAAWLTIPTELEGHLNDASPCKLPGDQNGVAQFLRNPLPQGTLPGGMAREEEQLLRSYHRQAQAHVRRNPSPDSITLYPGLYGQCLMHTLRTQLPEDRSRRLFRMATGHPTDTDPHYVCRGCQTSVLFPALQTLAHTVVKRYPSVALGDQADLGAFATLGHSSTGGPTIFWFDTYEGGIGAAETVFAKIDALLEASQTTLGTCTCTTIRGCPNCTQIAESEQENQALSKPAGSMLIDLLLGQAPTMRFGAFVYPSRQGEAFRQYYEDHERVPDRQTDDAEMDDGAPAQRDPFALLRLQRRHHRPVLEKAFEVRSGEITNELPRVSAAELQSAYLAVQRVGAVTDWALHLNMTPYEILEVLPDASLNMIRKIYRTIAREVHPDQHGDRREEMNRIVQIVNQAHEDIRQERETSDA